MGKVKVAIQEGELVARGGGSGQSGQGACEGGLMAMKGTVVVG